MIAKRVYRGCDIYISSRKSLVDLFKLVIVDFDVIVGMDWLHSSYVFLEF